MACLGSVLYDPGSISTHSCASLLAMTAIDTTNARITFTAPANGAVLVKIRVAQKGSASAFPMLLLGVLDGSTVRARQVPIDNNRFSNANAIAAREVVVLVQGLTPGNSYTWDAAYAVQVAVASTLIGAGGPNDASASNAYGALSFEVWETKNLLSGTTYDPAVAASAALTAATAMTAVDTTNLRLAFTVPASGQVLVRLRVAGTGIVTAQTAQLHLGVLEGATVRGRQASIAFTTGQGSSTATDLQVYHSEFVVAGLTPAANLTWDAAYGVEGVASAGGIITWGGPNDTAGADAYGGFTYEIWTA